MRRPHRELRFRPTGAVSAHRTARTGRLWLAVIAVIQLAAAGVIAGAGAAGLDAYRHHNVAGMAANAATFVTMYALLATPSLLGLGVRAAGRPRRTATER